MSARGKITTGSTSLAPLRPRPLLLLLLLALEDEDEDDDNGKDEDENEDEGEGEENEEPRSDGGAARETFVRSARRSHSFTVLKFKGMHTDTRGVNMGLLPTVTQTIQPSSQLARKETRMRAKAHIPIDSARRCDDMLLSTSTSACARMSS